MKEVWYLTRNAATSYFSDKWIIDSNDNLSTEDIKGYITDWLDEVEDFDKIVVAINKESTTILTIVLLQLLVQYNLSISIQILPSGECIDFTYIPPQEAVDFWSGLE